MSLFHAGVAPALDTNGDPISGAVWQFTTTGTTTAAPVYSDSELASSLGSTVTGDAAGRFVDIYLNDAVVYRARLWPDATMTGTPIKDIDPVNSGVDNAGSITFEPDGEDAVFRTVEDKLREIVSVKDFGATGDGTTDDTAAFQAAADANEGAEIYIPPGTYLVGNIGWLNFAGQRWRGASKYQTILKAEAGLTGAIFSNTDSGTASSAYVAVESIRFDLNGEDCVAIDLSSVNNSAVRDCYFVGGMGFASPTTANGSAIVTLTGLNGEDTTRLNAGQALFGPNIPAGATVLSVDNNTQFTMSANATGSGQPVYAVAGTAVRCASPLDAASYTNSISDCAGLYLESAFVAEDAANENTFTNCEAIASAIGFDIENGVDTARIIAGRSEGCLIGLRTGGRETLVIGARFENNFTADVSFMAGCERPSFFGCYTATSTTTFLNADNCTGLLSRGGGFPQRDIEPNVSNPRFNVARTLFAAASSAAAFQADDPSGVLPGGLAGFAAYFYDPLFLRNAAGTIEAVNATTDNSVLILSVDSSNRVSLSGYDRKAGAYTRLYLGEHFSLNGTGLEYGGVKVLGAQGASLPADATDLASAIALVNAIKARGKATGGHGLWAD